MLSENQEHLCRREANLAEVNLAEANLAQREANLAHSLRPISKEIRVQEIQRVQELEQNTCETRHEQKDSNKSLTFDGLQGSELSPFVSQLIDQAISMYKVPLAECRIPL